jgi:outer membrane protein W
MAEDKNVLRFDAIYSYPMGSTDDNGVTTEADKAFGAGLSYESRVTDLVGIQFGAGWTDHDIEVEAAGSDDTLGSLSVWPLYANVLIHPVERSDSVDWYFGGGFAYVIYDSLKLESAYGGGNRALDNDPTWTIRTGLDFKFGDGAWALNVDAQYFASSVEGIKVDPVNFGVGLAYRF